MRKNVDTHLQAAIRQVFQGDQTPAIEQIMAAGLSMADVFANLAPEERLSMLAREWPGANALVTRFARKRGMAAGEVSSRFADGVAEALKFAAEPQEWLHPRKVKKVVERVGFELDASFRALTVDMRSEALGQSLDRVFGPSLSRHFKDKLDARAGEWFASLELFAREHAALCATGSPDAATAYRERRRDELVERIRRDFGEYDANVRDLLAQIDGTTMAMFEPLPAPQAKTLRDQLLADAELVQSYLFALVGLMNVEPFPML